MTKKKTVKRHNKFNFYIYLVMALGVAVVLGWGINFKINVPEDSEIVVEPNIIMSEEQIPAMIEYGQGEVEIEEDIPTVESVDTATPQVNPEEEEPIECPENEECGRGAAFPYVDTSSPEVFIKETLGHCYNIDGYYDEQCWDYAALFFLNYAGHTFYTCGTGAAKGAIADGCWQKNAGSEFEMIWNAKELQAGDIVVFNNGTYGHVGMATGSYNNGYITLAGQNQGGSLCKDSKMGGRVNIINISLKYFAGAFRPKTYIKPEPTPEPETDTVDTYTVKKGDTLGAIVRKLGWYKGDKLFGDDGYCQKLAEFNGIKNRGLIYPEQIIKRK